jgi:hypothetical protein
MIPIIPPSSLSRFDLCVDGCVCDGLIPAFGIVVVVVVVVPSPRRRCVESPFRCASASASVAESRSARKEI